MVGNRVAAENPRPAGIGKTLSRAATTSPAKPPEGRPAQTLSPGFRPPVASGANSVTTPATSVPGMNGGSARFW